MSKMGLRANTKLGFRMYPWIKVEDLQTMGFKFMFLCCNIDQHKVDCLNIRRKGQIFTPVSELE